MVTSAHPRLFVTGATGQLGRLVIDALLKRVPVGSIVAGVRSIDGGAAKGLWARGIEVRAADFDKPEQLVPAFNGIDRFLLISAGEVGMRVEQHRNVIGAAKKAGVGLIAYTSLLHADTSPLALAEDHRQTETALGASGLPFRFVAQRLVYRKLCGIDQARASERRVPRLRGEWTDCFGHPWRLCRGGRRRSDHGKSRGTNLRACWR